MPKHKTRNTFYSNLQSKHRLLMKFGQFISYFKRKVSSKNSTKTAAGKLVPGPFVFAKN